MNQTLDRRLLWSVATLLLLLAVSWKFVLPKCTPTAVAPAGPNARMKDAPYIQFKVQRSKFKGVASQLQTLNFEL